MRPRLLRPLRLGLPAAAVLALALAGCGDPGPAEPAPAAAATPAARTTEEVVVDGSTLDSDGLTVRHLDGGTLRTVRVEDFPHR